jgi:hypothetical protein
VWADIINIAMIKRQRDIDGKVSNETAYFISSLESHALYLGQSHSKPLEH